MNEWTSYKCLGKEISLEITAKITGHTLLDRSLISSFRKRNLPISWWYFCPQCFTQVSRTDKAIRDVFSSNVWSLRIINFVEINGLQDVYHYMLMIWRSGFKLQRQNVTWCYHWRMLRKWGICMNGGMFFTQVTQWLMTKLRHPPTSIFNWITTRIIKVFMKKKLCTVQ